MYCGCRTCCGKLTWCFTILFLLLAVIGLAVGLYFTVPCMRTLVACNPATNGACWPAFWQCTRSGNAPGLYFFMACAGAACLFISLFSCCCFCCQKNPRARAKHQDQFVTGAAGAPGGAVAGHDAAAGGYSDQYAPGYQAYDSNYPGGKPNVAHV